jgi:dicarboxylate/amino acid:cation (Na+ or H+) symporter, DAACS family
MTETGPKSPLHMKILAGLSIGAAAGITSNILWRDAPALVWIVEHVAQPAGQIFLRMLFMVVVPLVFTSLVLGVSGLGDLTRLGRISTRTLGIFLATTVAAGALGMTLVNVVAPGESLDAEIRTGLMEEFSAPAAERVEAADQTNFGVQTFVNIVPRNPVDAAARGDMLGLIFFSLVFGVGVSLAGRERTGPLLSVVDGIAGAVEVMIGIAMKLAPIGVAALIFAVTAEFGFGLLRSLALYAAVVLGGLLIHQVGTLVLVARVFGGRGPAALFRKSRSLMTTAFGTSSSNATSPRRSAPRARTSA